MELLSGLQSAIVAFRAAYAPVSDIDYEFIGADQVFQVAPSGCIIVTTVHPT
jgi:hypothetical protein